MAVERWRRGWRRRGWRRSAISTATWRGARGSAGTTRAVWVDDGPQQRRSLSVARKQSRGWTRWAGMSAGALNIEWKTAGDSTAPACLARRPGRLAAGACSTGLINHSRITVQPKVSHSLRSAGGTQVCRSGAETELWPRRTSLPVREHRSTARLGPTGRPPVPGHQLRHRPPHALPFSEGEGKSSRSWRTVSSGPVTVWPTVSGDTKIS